MDYKAFLDNFKQIAAVLSVDLNNTDSSESFVIVDANEAYMSTVVKSADQFERNVPYTKYIKQDLNFEGMCEHCVRDGQPVHAYVDAAYYNSWMDIYMFPMIAPEKDRGYCLFSYNMTPKADADKMTDISADTALHVLKTCIRLRETDDFHAAMDMIITDTRAICNASRCCILLTDFDKRTCSVLCEDYVDHVNEGPMTSYMSDNFFDIVETWPRLIDGSNCFIIVNEGDMEYARGIAPEWVESLTSAGVEKLVIYPMRVDGKTLGYIWANNFDVTRTTMIKETLEVTSFILSAEIATHQMIKAMKILSSTDLLTNVMNRNAMNNRILDNDSGINKIAMPFGVFFVDVNGLKSTNDTKGHLAGDNLLKDVACTLKELFGEYEIYRVGGDEFLVITPDITPERFSELKEELCSDCERPGRAHYAVGACHSNETSDIKRAMSMADVRMYENKEEYYKKHPEYVWDRRVIKD